MCQSLSALRCAAHLLLEPPPAWPGAMTLHVLDVVAMLQLAMCVVRCAVCYRQAGVSSEHRPSVVVVETHEAEAASALPHRRTRCLGLLCCDITAAADAMSQSAMQARHKRADHPSLPLTKTYL